MRDFFKTKTTLLTGSDPEQKREEIRQYFHQTFDIDEHLFEVFADKEAMYLRADPLRHPLIFYYGHTAAFFINKLILAKLIDQRVNAKFEHTFAIGVDEMSWDDLDQTHYDWPQVDEVRAYRQQVRQLVDKLISALPMVLPITWDHPFWVIMMGIEHARIHLETSSVLIRQLPLKYLKPIDGWTICSEAGKAPQNELLPVAGGTIKIGKEFDSPLYGWDCEYGFHEKNVVPFKAAKYLCSNGEFLEFIKAGGYQNKTYWTEEGWYWNEFDKKGHPRFWVKTETGWKLRLIYNEIEMPWNWPVEVNQLEAAAFCKWKAEQTGKAIRLPIEEEYYALLKSANVPDQPYWEKAPGNINMEHFQSPAPVDTFQFGDFYDLIGNVWQWTETPITGFRSFKVHPLYDDFSTPTFDLKHNLFKGGSWISTGNEATQAARYAFRRHFYQHAGFRYIESEEPVTIVENLYETDPEVVSHCEAHYGNSQFNIANYRIAIAQFCAELFTDKPHSRALDLGCKVGRTTWELAKTFDSVTGVDFTARHIKVAIQLLEDHYFKYEFPEEGELVKYTEIGLKALGYEHLTDKVEFWQGDASNLKEIFSGYDLVLLNDVLDEMYNPAELLQKIHLRMNPGALLVIASTYDWNAKTTDPEKMLGGIRINGEVVTTTDGLENILKEHFEKEPHVATIPSVIPIHSKKATLKMMDVTVWRKL